MKLYDNDSFRETFMERVYELLADDPDNFRANEIIGLFDSAPSVMGFGKWVSVDERLPCLRETVLVCAYWHEHWGVYMGWNSGHGWSVSCGIGQRNDVKVSHWMSLPAPPEGRVKSDV